MSAIDTAADAGSLAHLETPVPLVDLERLEANLDRVAAYTAAHGLALRPHTKTHKSPRLLGAQLARGAVGATVATRREAEVMAAVADDVLLAYPAVGAAHAARVAAVAGRVRLSVALDSERALADLASSCSAAGAEAGVLVEVDVGMRRCGVGDPATAVALARAAVERDGVRYCGLLFYPGHIRQSPPEQDADLEALERRLRAFLDALGNADLEPLVVSGGSTPTLWSSHRIAGLTEIRPGTYVYNDRTTAAIGACAWEDCAYTVLATVVSVAAPGQAVVDAGSKALGREPLRAGLDDGLGALLDRPEVVVARASEEHGILDLSSTDWRPAVGERVRVVPNHVCVSVALHEEVIGVRGGEAVERWRVEARGRLPAGAPENVAPIV
ncbi:MAG TPA: alanine racemase [Longimicrobiales bacterium]|nr:alanine racemase [Longimicrobiales bacterium]